MPVNRAKIRVQNTAQGRVIQGGRSAHPQMVMEQAGQMARRAAVLAQSIQDTSIEEATLLAREAAVRVNESGGLDIPPRASARLGELANRSYNRVMDQMVSQRIATEMQRVSETAQNNHLYDPEGAAREMEENFAPLIDSAPDELRGETAQIAAGTLVGGVAQVGARRAQWDWQSQESQIPEMIATYGARVNEQVTLGDDATAVEIMREGVQLIRDLPPGMMDQGERMRQIESMRWELGKALLVRDRDLTSATPSQLTALAERLHVMHPDEIGYFNREDGTPDPAMAARAESYVLGLLGPANARLSEATDAAKERARQEDIRLGRAEDNPTNRASMDNMIGEELFGNRPMTANDWGTLTHEQRTLAVSGFKEAGFLPQSLTQYIHQLRRIQNPAELQRAFTTLIDMEEAANRDGQVMDFTAHMTVGGDDSLAMIYQRARDLHGEGFPTDKTIEDAIADVDAIRDAEWDDARLAERMNASRGTFARVDETTARDALGRNVQASVFPAQEVVYPEQMDQAVRLTEMHMRLGHTQTEALELTRQTMSARWQQSDFMSPASVGQVTTQYAPEQYYPEPSSDFWEILAGAGRTVAGQVIGEAEREINSGLIGLVLGGEAVNFGADALLASPFELMASEEIRNQVLSAAPGIRQQALAARGEEYFQTGENVLEPGVDYYLQENGAGGKPPIYNVFMRGENNTWIPLPEPLDIRERYTRLGEVDQILRSTRGPEGALLADDLKDPARRGAVFARMADILSVLDIEDEARRNEALLALMNDISGGQRANPSGGFQGVIDSLTGTLPQAGPGPALPGG